MQKCLCLGSTQRFLVLFLYLTYPQTVSSSWSQFVDTFTEYRLDLSQHRPQSGSSLIAQWLSNPFRIWETKTQFHSLSLHFRWECTKDMFCNGVISVHPAQSVPLCIAWVLITRLERENMQKPVKYFVPWLITENTVLGSQNREFTGCGTSEWRSKMVLLRQDASISLPVRSTAEILPSTGHLCLIHSLRNHHQSNNNHSFKESTRD